MASSDLEIKAKEAFIDDHFELAVDLYTQAISLCPDSAELFADRAQANIKLKSFTEAVADATRSIQLDSSKPKAYLRKGLACIKLEEYTTAKAALQAGASLAPEDSRFINLIKECDERIAEETRDVPEQPSEKSPMQDDKSSNGNVHPPQSDPSVSDQAAVVQSTKPKYRHEFFQKPEEVVVTIFAKGLSADSVTIDFGEQTLSVTVEVPGEDAYHFQPRLFGKIVPSKCRYEILTTKIEIRLAKAEPIHWTSLEFSKTNGVVQRVNPSSDIRSERPSYPTSKPKGTDWDKVVADVKKEEKDEKLDGDAALNKFFRDIYQDSDEDTRRAMKKSFVESSGTVLSTNWKEVGKKKVEGSPPDGMEMRKWEY